MSAYPTHRLRVLENDTLSVCEPRIMLTSMAGAMSSPQQPISAAPPSNPQGGPPNFQGVGSMVSASPSGSGGQASGGAATAPPAAQSASQTSTSSSSSGSSSSSTSSEVNQNLAQAMENLVATQGIMSNVASTLASVGAPAQGGGSGGSQGPTVVTDSDMSTSTSESGSATASASAQAVAPPSAGGGQGAGASQQSSQADGPSVEEILPEVSQEILARSEEVLTLVESRTQSLLNNLDELSSLQEEARALDQIIREIQVATMS